MILTSNLSYGDWDRLIGDPVLVTAMLDRLLHLTITINIPHCCRRYGATQTTYYKLRDRFLEAGAEGLRMVAIPRK